MLHVLALGIADGPSEVVGGPQGIEKFRRIGHLMAPLQSVGRMNT